MAVKEKTSEELLEARLDELLAQAQKKAEEIIEKAEQAAKSIIDSAAMNSAAAVPGTEKKLEKDDSLEELVQVRLFKDTNKYKDDVYVAVNGENCIIQRGVPVMIKKKFALALEQSAMQDEFAASMMQGLVNEYHEKEKHLN